MYKNYEYPFARNIIINLTRDFVFVIIVVKVVKMLLYILATFCIATTTGYSVIDENYLVLESDTDELYWAEIYTVKAVRVYLTSNLVEDYTAWKTNQSSRVDYNQGAVKVLTRLADEGSNDFGYKYEVHPETTEEELNKIVCHFSMDAFFSDELKLDDILPRISEDEPFVIVGNETIDGIETVKFERTKLTREIDFRETAWAFYSEDRGWVPVKYEIKRFNTVLGFLIRHDIWTYFDFVTDIDSDVFDIEPYGCKFFSVKHTANSEKITKELMFIDPDNEKHVDHIFNHFQNKFGRKYVHLQEHASRKNIFRENMRLIASVNRRNLTYKLGINEFSDWTPEEIRRSQGLLPRPEGMVATVAFPYKDVEITDAVSNLPKEYDMRLFGYISPVKHQETCGSCWTFAASAVTESALARINGGKVLSLSSQAIVDCAYEELAEMYVGGCNGGFDYAAYDFIMKHGLPTEQEYGPYKNRDGYCHIGNMTKTYKITGYTEVTKNNFNAMKVAVVNHGPLYVAVQVTNEFLAYSSGIFYQANENCDPNHPNHAMTLVGYGERYGELFWILKNSWGDRWGIDGYMLIAAKDNVCGVASRPTYPVF